MKDRNTEEKPQKTRRCIIKPLFCSLHFSLFLFTVFLAHLLFLFCVMVFKATDMSEGMKGGAAKRTIRHNNSVIVGEGKIAHHRIWDVMKQSCGNCYVCERFHWLCFNGRPQKFEIGTPIQRLNLTICARCTSAPLSSYSSKHEYRTFPGKNFHVLRKMRPKWVYYSLNRPVMEK